MKRIFFVIGSLSNGGAERVVSLIADKLDKVGYSVTIVTLTRPENNYIDNKNIKIISIDEFVSHSKMKYLQRVRLLRKILKNENPDVIISFVAIINIYTVLASLFLKNKIILSERNDPYQNPERKVIRIIRDILYNKADRIVFQTNDAKEYFNSSIKNKGIIIPNPIKSDLPYWKEDSAEKSIITACRLAHQKNLPMLIESYIKLIDEFPEYELIIFGEGELRNKLEKIISEKGLNKKIKLPGFSENIHDEMSKASMFIMPSNYEGISNSLLEALAIGVPVISTDSPIGGAKMFIQTNRNGILIKVGDGNALLDAMKKIADNTNFAKEISYESRKIRELLDLDKIIEKWVEVIES